MVEHQQDAYPGQPIRVSLEVVRKVKRTLDRKVLEDTMILESSQGSLMNRNGEWGQNLPAKFGIIGSEDGSYGLKRKDRDEAETHRQKERELRVVLEWPRG